MAHIFFHDPCEIFRFWAINYIFKISKVISYVSDVENWVGSSVVQQHWGFRLHSYIFGRCASLRLWQSIHAYNACVAAQRRRAWVSEKCCEAEHVALWVSSKKYSPGTLIFELQSFFLDQSQDLISPPHQLVLPETIKPAPDISEQPTVVAPRILQQNDPCGLGNHVFLIKSGHYPVRLFRQAIQPYQSCFVLNSFWVEIYGFICFILRNYVIMVWPSHMPAVVVLVWGVPPLEVELEGQDQNQKSHDYYQT